MGMVLRGVLTFSPPQGEREGGGETCRRGWVPQKATFPLTLVGENVTTPEGGSIVGENVSTTVEERGLRRMFCSDGEDSRRGERYYTKTR